ncbi:RpiB/LacA/LacB family sugar-phosphate isomerase [Listeria monocytogenes]|nr:RpiB/LacA/LacB family sugar-phosphate isomerase [Listeria monocytogenes]
MKIAIINASSQKQKNPIIQDCLQKAIDRKGHEVINLGMFPDEIVDFSYVQIAYMTSLILSSEAVDFVITGCSSGNGMMLACNSLPNVLCGYVSRPEEAFLFGRINNGNAISIPLGLNFGWAGELNLRYCLEQLFIEEPLGLGYPKEEALRKIEDANMIHQIKKDGQHDIISLTSTLDSKFIEPIFKRKLLLEFIIRNGKNKQLVNYLKNIEM